MFQARAALPATSLNPILFRTFIAQHTTALAVILCLFLGGSTLGDASLWADELFSRFYQQVLGWHYMFTEGLTLEPTPPTYPVLLHGWMYLWGDSEAAMRSLSLLAVVGAVPLVALLARTVADARTAKLAALLFASNPVAVYFAQEARVYALVLPVAALLLWAMATLVRDPASRRGALAYVGAASLCMYMHTTTILVVASCSGVVGCWWLLTHSGRLRPLIARWLGLQAAIAIVTLPYTVHVLVVSRSGGLEWMPALSLAGMASTLTSLLTGMLTPHIFPGLELAILLLLALGLSLWMRPPASTALLVLAVVPVLFFTLMCGVSLARPILVARILAWITVPFSVLCARQIMAGGRPGRAVLGMVLLTTATGLWFQFTTPNAGKEPWRDALQAVADRMRPNDLIVLGPHGNALIMQAYAPRQRNIRILDSTLPPTVITRINERLGVTPISPAELQTRIAQGARVWVLAIAFDWNALAPLKRTLPASYDERWQCFPKACVEVTGWLAGPRPVVERETLLQ